MTDASGTVVWAADYKPFGEATITVSTITNNLRFPGQYYDSETGLHYNYFRDYNPALGRYAQADPIGLKGGLNLYRYAGNNPVGRMDPTGLAMTGLPNFVNPGAMPNLGTWINILNKWGNASTAANVANEINDAIVAEQAEIPYGVSKQYDVYYTEVPIRFIALVPAMKNLKKILLAIIMLLLVVFGFWLRGCVDIDRCLDRGGRWNYEKGICEYQETEQGQQKK